LDMSLIIIDVRPNEIAQPPLTRPSCAPNFNVERVMCKFTRRSAVGCSDWLDLLSINLTLGMILKDPSRAP
jgi:hypothetical protein